jgi:hypothetical protein
VTAGPEHRRMAGALGRGRMRVSDADRERAVEILKIAFEQERLSKDELDVRAERAYLSRTYDELTACTAGIPRERPRPLAPPASQAAPTAVPPNTAPHPEPVYRSRKRVVKLAVGLSACIVIPPALVTAFFTYYGGFAVMMLVAVVGVILTGSPIGPGASIRDRI